jgi:hypothetical protein
MNIQNYIDGYQRKQYQEICANRYINMEVDNMEAEASAPNDSQVIQLIGRDYP